MSNEFKLKGLLLRVLQHNVPPEYEDGALLAEIDAALSKPADQQGAPVTEKLETRCAQIESMLAELVKENDLAMPNENYQWMYSPMRARCVKLLGISNE